VFVGNLIARKGVHELVAAAKQLHAAGVDLRIDVYGAGDPEPFAFDGVSSRYAGTIPFGEAQSVIAGYDFLVLPSHYDGWGVVVNESVLAGVPVLCSEGVGAGAFLRKWNCGMSFRPFSVEALAASLRSLATDAPLRERLRTACNASRDRLAPQVAGRYMSEVIAQGLNLDVRIANPWYDA
jgi:glycosyltransferase involved in cell wall biosynthesis